LKNNSLEGLLAPLRARPHSLGLLVTLGNSRGVDMADISSHTRSTPDIVQAQPSDEGVGLEQKGQGLSDPTASAEDGDFALGTGRGGEGSEGGGFESGSSEHFGG
jgi:hypothetical protein